VRRPNAQLQQELEAERWKSLRDLIFLQFPDDVDPAQVIDEERVVKAVAAQVNQRLNDENEQLVVRIAQMMMGHDTDDDMR